jgi:phage shock protein PspC (stress-responsive transcriptional regulator)
MGRPEEIVTEEEAEPEKRGRFERKKNRRLYRDPDNAVIGGVCAGLAEYFDMDNVLMRILFIILTLLAGGIPVIIYIVLWIAVPKAVTAAQKLEMRGEKITVSNIGKTVREEYESVKDNLRRASESEGYRRTESFVARFFHVIGIIILTFLKIIGAFFALILIVIGIAIIFGALGAVFFGLNFAPFTMGHLNINIPELVGPFFNPTNLSVLIVAISLLILIPVIALIYGMLKLIFKFKAKDRSLGLASLAIWIIALVTTLTIVFHEGKKYSLDESANISQTIENLPGDTLYIAMDNSLPEGMEEGNTLDIDHHWRFSTDMKTIAGQVRINFAKSPDDNFKVQIKKNARGRDREEANDVAQNIIYGYSVKDDTLKLSSYFRLEKESNRRLQKVTVSVMVPVGKAVHPDAETAGHVHNTFIADDYSEQDLAGKSWIMTDDGLKLAK